MRGLFLAGVLVMNLQFGDIEKDAKIITFEIECNGQKIVYSGTKPVDTEVMCEIYQED